MGQDIGGYEQRPDWPNEMGPLLVIRRVSHPRHQDGEVVHQASGGTTSDRDLNVEVEHAIHLAGIDCDFGSNDLGPRP
jgi:hypothetical protein